MKKKLDASFGTYQYFAKRVEQHYRFLDNFPEKVEELIESDSAESRWSSISSLADSFKSDNYYDCHLPTFDETPLELPLEFSLRGYGEISYEQRMMLISSISIRNVIIPFFADNSKSQLGQNLLFPIKLPFFILGWLSFPLNYVLAFVSFLAFQGFHKSGALYVTRRSTELVYPVRYFNRATFGYLKRYNYWMLGGFYAVVFNMCAAYNFVSFWVAFPSLVIMFIGSLGEPWILVKFSEQCRIWHRGKDWYAYSIHNRAQKIANQFGKRKVRAVMYFQTICLLLLICLQITIWIGPIVIYSSADCLFIPATGIFLPGTWSLLCCLRFWQRHFSVWLIYAFLVLFYPGAVEIILRANHGWFRLFCPLVGLYVSGGDSLRFILFCIRKYVTLLAWSTYQGYCLSLKGILSMIGGQLFVGFVAIVWVSWPAIFYVVVPIVMIATSRPLYGLWVFLGESCLIAPLVIFFMVWSLSIMRRNWRHNPAYRHYSGLGL